MPRRGPARIVAVSATAAAILLAGGCGDQPADTDDTAGTTISAPAAVSGSPSEPATSSAPERSGAQEPDVEVREIEVTIADGTVTPPPGRVEVSRGERVRLTVTSDEADEIHVHGYDVAGPVTPERLFETEFVADLDGQYDVETHDSGLLLFQLLVR